MDYTGCSSSYGSERRRAKRDFEAVVANGGRIGKRGGFGAISRMREKFREERPAGFGGI